MGENHTTPGRAREQGRNAALAGREIFVNPHIGIDADAWFEGYRDVPEADRGSRPDLMAQSSTRRLARHPRGKGVKALGWKSLKGSTPKPFDAAIKAEVAEAEARTPRPWGQL
jgi:hypothetical protein